MVILSIKVAYLQAGNRARDQKSGSLGEIGYFLSVLRKESRK